jgi:hypothetical protein
MASESSADVIADAKFCSVLIVPSRPHVRC